MLDYIAIFFLAWVHIPLISLVFLVGFIFRREIFGHAAFLLFLTMLFNPLLKHLFKVPLMPHLGEGYAFPSGHMQVAVAFYGWLFFCLKGKRRYSLILLLAGMAWALVFRNYHSIGDVMGALGAGIFSIALYQFFLQKIGFDERKWKSYAILFLPVIVLFLMNMGFARLGSNILLALGGFCFVSLLWWILARKNLFTFFCEKSGKNLGKTVEKVGNKS